MARLKDTHLVVLASTFPRWEKDKVPSFVLDFIRHIAPNVRSVTAVVPHFPGAKRRETLDGGILVKRFRYAYPYAYENLTYGQVAKKTIWYKLRGVCYVVAEFWVALWTCLIRQPLLINAHWLIPQGFVGLVIGRLLGARVVVSIHGQDATFKLSGVMGTLTFAVKRFILKHADAVVANSSATQALCKQMYAGRDYPVIPMGVDMERFRGEAVHGSNGYEVIFVGRLAEVKGVAYLCEAMRLLHDKHNDVHLKIVGDGPERAGLERYVRDNALGEVITFAGWVQPEELPAQYHAADVFAGPSIEDAEGRIEAFGLVFAEAAAAGLPVVTTDIGGTRDIVQDKITGLIVPQKNAEALCDALEHLYAHREEARAMGARGRAFVEQHFSWPAIAGKYLKILAAE